MGSLRNHIFGSSSKDCLSNADCPPGHTCVSGSCVPTLGTGSLGTGSTGTSSFNLTPPKGSITFANGAGQVIQTYTPGQWSLGQFESPSPNIQAVLNHRNILNNLPKGITYVGICDKGFLFRMVYTVKENYRETVTTMVKVIPNFEDYMKIMNMFGSEDKVLNEAGSVLLRETFDDYEE